MNDRKTFYCAHCGARLEAEAGATVTCTACGRETQEPSRWAPRPPEAPPAPAPSRGAPPPSGPPPAPEPLRWGPLPESPPTPPPPEPSSWGAPTPGPAGARPPEAGPTGWGRPPAGPELPGPGAGPSAPPPEWSAGAPVGPGHEPPPMAPVPYQPPPGNGWAIASLVLGILGIAACLGPITGLPAVICAVVAIRAKQPAGLAVAGLITGIVATLGGLLLMFMVALPFLMDAGAW